MATTLFTLVALLVQCGFSCSAVIPTFRASPFSSFVSVSTECANEEVAAAQCLLDNALNPDECTACFGNYYPQAETFSCTDIDDETCEGIGVCDCGVACGSQLLAALNCLYPLCDLSCPDVTATPTVPLPAPTPQMPAIASPTMSSNQAPTMVPCPDESTNLASCLLGSGTTNPLDCSNCISGYFSSPEGVNSCEDLNGRMCSAIQECPCSTCGSEIVEWSNCLIAVPNCTISCPDSISPPTPSPSVSASVGQPSENLPLPGSDMPSDVPSYVPSERPFDEFPDEPTGVPTVVQSDVPSDVPSHVPSPIPSGMVFAVASEVPSHVPSDVPFEVSINVPSGMPVPVQSDMPSDVPSATPSGMYFDVVTPMPTVVQPTFPPVTLPPVLSGLRGRRHD